MKIKLFLIGSIILLLWLSSCSDSCDDNDCPVSPQLIHRLNVIDADQKSVYGSSTNQFDKSELKISSELVDFKFEDSLLILTQRLVVRAFNVRYNDTTSTKITVKYQTISPNDECCSDYLWPNQTLIDNTPLCDTCEVIIVEI